ncbi:MAG: tyrosine--tRNA ligase [Gammaproteobacteria bacterium]|nr:tyrosine--tRNA ligase [Gammaproteobacteria bacterium]
MTDILEELDARGLIVQRSHAQEFQEHIVSASRTVYCGFDPTAPSLHVGNLVPLLALARFQQAGHRPVILVGGATGLIGDPSGRDQERTLQPTDVVAAWVERLTGQTNRFVSFEGSNAALVVNNYEWASQINLIEFLRDVGKHFSINAMIQRDAVKARLEREESGLSYTEFSYALVQALDFLQLHRSYGCTIQIGGSDQWGNIVSGVDLIRRTAGATAYALTFPLVARSDGKKFGKSTGGAIWLDADLTSPYAFYQFWLNTDDADVGRFLRYFTFVARTTIDEIVTEHGKHPHQRDGQRELARQVTRLVHGDAGLQAAERITEALFGGEIDKLTAGDFEQLRLDGVDNVKVNEGDTLLDAMVALDLAPSKGRARQLVQQGGVALNGQVIVDIDAALSAKQALHDRFHLLRRGKKHWALLVHAA